MTNEIIVSSDKYMHLTYNSGLRIRADDARLTIVLYPSSPLVVIESNDGYTPIASRNKLRVMPHVDGASIQADDLDVMPMHDSLAAAVEAYLGRYPLAEASSRADGLKRVINLDMWLPDGTITHNYQDAIRLIEDLVRQELSKGTLLYLPGWHAPYDTKYPAYAPCAELGGSDTFRQMLESADQAGVTVMPHLNFWAYDVSSGLLNDYTDFQVQDEQGQPMGWPGILKTGYTNPLAFMRVEDPRWQEVFFRYIEPLLSDYKVKALFLDQIGCWTGHDKAFDDATDTIICRLRTLQPGLMLGGEVLREDLITQIDIYQAWGQPWCGVEADFTDNFSPIVALLFSSKTKLISHLGVPCAKPCRYCWTNYPFIVEHGCEKAFEIAQEHRRLIGGIPHVRLAYNRHGIDTRSLAVLRESIV
jgi:hypothetical protein